MKELRCETEEGFYERKSAYRDSRVCLLRFWGRLSIAKELEGEWNVFREIRSAGFEELKDSSKKAKVGSTKRCNVVFANDFLGF